MSIINPTTFDRNIFSNNHFDAFSKEVETTQTVFKNSLDHIKSYTPYEGYDSGHIPGITSALYAPYEVYLSLTSIFKGHEQHDIEGCFDNTFRFLGIPFSTLTSLGQFFAHIGTITVVGTKLFSLIYCSIELILELLNLQRVVEFQKEMHLSLLEEIEVGLQESSPEKQLALLQKTLDHVKNTPELINYLKGKENLQAENYSDVFTHLKTHLLALDILTLKTKYFQLSSDQIQHVRKNISCSCDASKKTESEMITKALNHLLQGQKTKASRRIGAWLVQEIDTNIETLEKKIHSSNPEAGLKEAEDLLKTIKIQ
ncbi:MAG: hypothetical protein KAR79_05445, partial [Simkaniaceae bacterium]|nr:hypothetical protein [Simkaniaceae bacterium]